MYWGMDGALNAIRWRDFKAHFNFQVGPANPFKGSHMVTPNAPLIFNLRAEAKKRLEELRRQMKNLELGSK